MPVNNINQNIKTILFVDDEIKILDALKRKLHKWKNDWDILYTTSGKEALDLLQKRAINELPTVDVVVCDMRMPGINGYELLKIIAKKYPQTIRFMLSGQSERNILIKSLNLIHQYFSKPCDTEVLFYSIFRIFNVRNFINNSNIINLVSQMKTLPVLPKIYNELEAELTTEDYSIKSVSDIVSKDIAISAKVLQLANSSYFAIGKSINCTQKAISIIGIECLKDLILTLHLFSQADDEMSKTFRLNSLWKHSLSTAHIAKYIATVLELNDSEKDLCFTAALFHDIGKLILATQFPVLYSDVYFKYNSKDSISLESYENQTFKTSHAEVGAYLMSLWGFNDIIVESILFHHNLSNITCNDVLPVVIVSIADYLDHQINSSNQSMKTIDNYSIGINYNYLSKIEKNLNTNIRKTINNHNPDHDFVTSLLTFLKKGYENEYKHFR